MLEMGSYRYKEENNEKANDFVRCLPYGLQSCRL